MCDLYCGSLPFMAPEILFKKPYNRFAADIWSFGVAFYFMATGRLPWKNRNRGDLISSIVYDNIDFSRLEDEQISTILQSCLIRDPSKRATPSQLLSSPLLACPQVLKSKPNIIASKIMHSYSRITKPFIKKKQIGKSNSTYI